MIISLIFRKKNPLFYSIENVFGSLLQYFQKNNRIELHYVPDYGVSLRNIFDVKSATTTNNDGIFHVTGDVHYVVFGLPRKKAILTIHDCVFIEREKGFKRWLLIQIFLKWPVWYCRHITTISEKSKEEIIRYSNCSASKINVIPDPVGAHLYFREKEFNKDCPELLFIGSTDNKNLDRVIEALKGLVCRLRIVGDLSTLQVDRLQKNKINYISESRLDKETLADRFAASDIILFPSLYEGFGLPVVEGFKSGRVVVTSNLSPMKDVAAGAACLVDPYDVSSIRSGIIRVVENADYRNGLIKKGLEIAKEYEPNSIASRYLSLYQEVYKSCVE